MVSVKEALNDPFLDKFDETVSDLNAFEELRYPTNPDNSRLVTQQRQRGSDLCYRSGVQALLHIAARRPDGDRLYTASDV